MKKFISIIILSLVFIFLFTQFSFADRLTGAVAKIPYPLTANDKLSLEDQKVKITVYSTFIEVESEYRVQNLKDSDVTATFGFPFYINTKDKVLGESAPMGLKVYESKKKRAFVDRKVEKDPNNDDILKEWYIWQVDIGKKRQTNFKVTYYLKMKREMGIPHLAYALDLARAYEGKVKSTQITINMPFECREVPASSAKMFKGESYLYSSIPGYKISKNFMFWDLPDMEPAKNLDLYFYKNGYPDWEVSSKGSKEQGKNSCYNVLDGDPTTYWMTTAMFEGVGSTLFFKPVIRYFNGKTGKFSPKIYKIGVVSGNCQTLSAFYNYSHLKEAEVEEYIKPSQDNQDKNEKKEKETHVDRPENIDSAPPELFTPDKKRKQNEEIVILDCQADWNLQIFDAKKPLSTQNGPLRLLITMVYPGQKFKELCLGEILIFDRQPQETYEYLTIPGK